MINGDSIYCDCCGTEKLASIVSDTLVIRDRRHGQKHVAVIKIQDLLDKLAGKADNTTKDRAASMAKD